MSLYEIDGSLRHDVGSQNRTKEKPSMNVPSCNVEITTSLVLELAVSESPRGRHRDIGPSTV